jgi:peptidyl-prolyl cis-trans isomerase D
MRLREKYTAILANSAYVPKWMIEKMNADNSLLASVSYVAAPYFSIPDSSVKISDAEIQEYIDAHKDRFKQEESRSIAYVTFDASANSADSARVRKELIDFKKEFAQTGDIEGYLGRVGTESPYFDGYIGKDRIQVPFKDSILAEPKGGVYGPYIDGGNFVIAKLIDVKTLPDSVRARHILVATVNPQTQQPIMEDSVAKKKIDSIANVMEHGGNWDSVAARVSDDPGSKEKGGDLGYFTADRMVKEFADFCFNGKKGEKKIVKSQFGYHYIEILDQKNFEPAYKIAYISKKIDVSQETDQAASGLASQFAGESRDAKAFDDNVQKYHLQKLLGPDIPPAETNIPGLGANRQLVRWAYDATLGNVSEPFPVGDKYVVALLTEINAAGTMTPAKARNQVEPILRNKKKAEEIIKKEGSPASLDAAATAAGQPIQHADSVLFARSTLSATSGQEGKVVGAAFDKEFTGKPISPAISGNTGVYFIKIENVSAMSNPNADVQQQRFMIEQQMRSMVNYGFSQTLQKLATVKDYRAKFY